MSLLSRADNVKVPALLVEALRGNRDALGELLILHRRAIRAVCLRRLRKFGMQHLLEEMIQDVYVDALVAFKNFDPFTGRNGADAAGNKFTGWMVKVAASRMNDFFRTLPRHPLIDADRLVVGPEDVPGWEEKELDRSGRMVSDSWACVTASSANSPLAPEVIKNRPQPKPKTRPSRATKGTGRGAFHPPARLAQIRANRAAFVAQHSLPP